MCGVLFLKGPGASKKIKEGLNIMNHRGPDDISIWEKNDISLGFVRLSINEQNQKGAQPYSYENYVAAINGEIYNHLEIREKYQIDSPSKCDTHIVLPVFSKKRDMLLTNLDGFYSGVIYEKTNGNIYLIRDHIGKKPLFYGQSNDDYFITSELKAINQLDWFKQAPIGLSILNTDFRHLKLLQKHTTPAFSNNLLGLLENAVKKRLPSKNQKLGIFLSGGLDSSIVTTLSQKYHNNIYYFILGASGEDDARMAKLMVNKLGLKNVTRVPIPKNHELKKFLQEVVYHTESYNPSIISNGLATYLLSKEARKQGVKVILSGEGADELFGGYHYGLDNKQWKLIQSSLISDLHFTELRRLDLTSMAHSVEVRCPFLDQKVTGFAKNLKSESVFKFNKNKIILRATFAHLLPNEIATRKKMSFDVGSGIRKMVVEFLTQNNNTEKEELYKIWREIFPNRNVEKYFHSYPVFDEAIEKRGIKHK